MDKTTIIVKCKDGSTRVINCYGRRDYSFCVSLGRDLEGHNYLSCEIK